MEGTLSERAKKLFKDPEKARMFLDYVMHPANRRLYTITVTQDKIEIELKKSAETEMVTTTA